MEVKSKKVFKIPVEDILKAFGLKEDKEKYYIYYSSSKDELQIEVEEV